MVNEKNNWQVLEWIAPIAELHKDDSNTNGDLIIKGIALVETTSRNGISYVAKELKKAGETWTGKPMLLDHEAKIDNIVGRVNFSEYSDIDKSVHYEARIVNEDIKAKLQNGLITDVSIGAKVDDIVENKKAGTLTAVGIEGLEISFVAVPGVTEQRFTSIGEAFQNGFDIKQELVMTEQREQKMITEDTKKDIIVDADMEIAKKLLSGIKLRIKM